MTWKELEVKVELSALNKFLRVNNVEINTMFAPDGRITIISKNGSLMLMPVGA